MAKYIKTEEGYKTIDSISKQANWNEIDELSLAYINNRPFYEDIEGLKIAVPETTISIAEGDKKFGLTCINEIDEGQKYIVTLDGIKYISREVVGKENYLKTYVRTAYGDITLDTHVIEDINIYIYTGESVRNPLPFSGEHTIAIDIVDSYSFKTLDEKFIPDNIARVEDIANNKYKQILMQDDENGFDYIVRMHGGKLISYCAASSIAITTQPTKVAYTVGETFDPIGMVVTATCQDGSTREVANYTYQTDALTADVTSVKITYAENGQTFTATVAITVAASA